MTFMGTMFNPLSEEDQINPCSNFGCSHICIPTVQNAAACYCNFGFQLDTDGKGCSPLPKDNLFFLMNRRIAEVYSYNADTSTAYQWPMMNLDDATVDMFVWINDEDEDVEMVYSGTGGRFNTHITHRSMKQFGKSESVTLGANAVAHIAVDPARKVAFWTQDTKLYASSFAEGGHPDKANYKMLVDFATLD